MDVAEVMRQRIKEVRTRKGWSQRDLAARMDEAGVPLDPASIARIETGKRQVKVSEMVALAAVLEVSPMHLLLPQTKGRQVSVTPTQSVATKDAREWFRGFDPLPGQSNETMAIERGDDYDLASFVVRMFEEIPNSWWSERALDDMAEMARKKEADDA